MRGTFVTSKFPDRAAWIAQRPSQVQASRNSFTLNGLELLWRILTGQERNEQGGLSDHLGKARLIVGNGQTPANPADVRLAGTQTAYAELDENYPQIQRLDSGVALILRGTFGEQAGNFEWRERGVSSIQGQLIDRAVADQGRKAAGSIWTLEAALELTYA